MGSELEASMGLIPALVETGGWVLLMEQWAMTTSHGLSLAMTGLVAMRSGLPCTCSSPEW